MEPIGRLLVLVLAPLAPIVWVWDQVTDRAGRDARELAAIRHDLGLDVWTDGTT